MEKFSLVVPARIVAAMLALWCMPDYAQSPAAPPAAPLQTATVASLNDALLAKATSLYSSTAKTGLKSFDCAVHPDWSKIMSSARKGAPVAADDPTLTILSTVKITFHVVLKGGSRLDWQVPIDPQKPIDHANTTMLEQTHHGLETTLEGLLKLWVPLVDGSIAETLGEDDLEIAQTADGYSLHSKDKSKSLHTSVVEEFDRNLILKKFDVVDAGTTVDIAPAFKQTAQGLLLSSFVAHILPAGAAPENVQEMHVGLEYQAVAGAQVPSQINIDLPGVVQMDFKLDGCTVNPPSN